MTFPEEAAIQERTLTYRILGPIEVLGPNGRLNLSPGRQEVVLGMLLLNANRVVSIDTLIEAVWGERPPATARSQVQICVSALRRSFAAIGMESPIVTRTPGYLMRIEPDRLDAAEFDSRLSESAVAAQDGRLEESAALLRSGLALWRGAALSGASASRLLQSGATRLDERRAAALESWIDLELQLGRHHELIGDIRSLVEEYPLREGLRGKLMLALYRSGRQAEALEAYRQGRKLLVEQLGLEPGAELRELESAILTNDETLKLDIASASATPETSPFERPWLLPSDIADFTGRDDLVDALEALLLGLDQDRPSGVVPVAVVSGKPGVGKSALAVHVAHRIAETRFPDGQVYIDLKGSRTLPVEPDQAVTRVLRVLGIPGPAIPEDLDERTGMYRSLLAHRRILILLEDAATEAQVAPLLPGSATCAVIVTSRARLTGVPGSRTFEVDVMDRDQALALLRRVIGPARVDAQPAAADALIRMVGGLPLALRTVAARLSARPQWSLVSMVERLTDERHRLDELAHGEMVVRASLTLSYDGLEEAARRLMPLLSLVDGDSIPSWTAGALLGEGAPLGAELLDQLADVHMLDLVGIDPNTEPRYRFHDLIQIFARELLEHVVPAPVRAAAVGRVTGGWLGMAEEAHRQLYGGDFTVLHGTAARWHPGNRYLEPVRADPMGWLENERTGLCVAVLEAAEAGLDELCWDLAGTLVTLFEARNYVDDWWRTHERAMEATRRAGNSRGTGALLCSLGSLHLSQGRGEQARSMLASALALFEELGDRHGRGMVLRNLAMLEYGEGGLAKATRLYGRALADFRQVGDRIGEAYVLNRTAQIELDRRRFDLASRQLHEALRICRDVGSLRVEAQVLHRLGQTRLLQRRYEEAIRVMSAALEITRRNGDLIGESYALHGLGVANSRLGRYEDGESLLRGSLTIREQIFDQVSASKVRLDLAVLLTQRGDRGPAARVAEQALATFRDRGLIVWETEASAVLMSIRSGRGVSHPD